MAERTKNFFCRHKAAALIACGLAGGFINGLLGAGSGIIFVFFLNYLFGDGGADAQRDVFALSLGAVFFITLFSVVFYALNGQSAITEASPYILPAVTGGLVGAALLGKINVTLLKVIFAAVIIYSGISMI